MYEYMHASVHVEPMCMCVYACTYGCVHVDIHTYTPTHIYTQPHTQVKSRNLTYNRPRITGLLLYVKFLDLKSRNLTYIGLFWL
jgi:hypothetical protein